MPPGSILRPDHGRPDLKGICRPKRMAEQDATGVLPYALRGKHLGPRRSECLEKIPCHVYLPVGDDAIAHHTG